MRALNEKGYMYTLTAVLFLFLVFFLISFYSSMQTQGTSSSVNTLTTDRLHYFLTSMKNDLHRATFLSGKRSLIETMDYVERTGDDFEGYSYQNCTPHLNYSVKGHQSALIELMLCGTLHGTPNPDMDNQTLLDWKKRILNKSDDADIVIEKMRFTGVDMAMYDPFHIGLIWHMDLELHDKHNNSYYQGYKVPMDTVLIDIKDSEDPLYYLYSFENSWHYPHDNDTAKTQADDLAKYFTDCYFEVFNGTSFNKIVNKSAKEDDRCYFTSAPQSPPLGPCLFDRYEGHLGLSEKYVNQSRELFGNPEIGLESVANPWSLRQHEVKVNFTQNYSWIDYIYMRHIPNSGECCVNNTMEKYNSSLLFDADHIARFDVPEYDCTAPLNCTHP